MVNQPFSSAEWNRRVTGLAPAGARPVTVVNPLSSDGAELPLSLVPNLLLDAARNRRQFEPWIRAFEIARAFWSGDGGAPEERAVIGGIACGKMPASGIFAEARNESFYDAKGIVEALLAGLRVSAVRWSRDGVPPFLHPGKAATIRREDRVLGYLGGVHPDVAKAADLEGDVWVFEIAVGELAACALPPIVVEALAKYPPVVRDLALVADETFEARAVIDMLSQHPDLLVENVLLFDVYRGSPIPAGKKSLAYSIAYRAPERTLTDDEVNALHRRLTEMLRTRLGVEPRT